MAEATTTRELTVADSGLFAEVQQFYTRQMQLLDSGLATEWSRTFTDDGVFRVGDESAEGRETIARRAAEVIEEFAKANITRRHWIGMLSIEEVDPAAESVSTRCYALVLETPYGGAPVVRRSTVCTDTLVRSNGALRLRHRHVTRDGVDR
ncbi:nuclear transport factor 2 family protein [Nocardia asteroides]